ncbi:hypothetical protein [uncultured Gammaproteobacteria bacterium]|uniref:hypothetical protein n=1 Tax=Bathymodiolus heckerae thiotrophic gill symbiont TaxID=1052212 RepID=UPI0010BBF6B5|nr:hypothetical protein [Bathymodiolus heckerae thiotrophic gill symbiont]CAC9437745.1 hypothetical protein [uncultured Gammaproteobacteria bacterium]SMN13027.1 hypothetical protein BHECKSOX2_1598 [Bathymodiolus heckerae thiotrophic gill symbiont]
MNDLDERISQIITILEKEDVLIKGVISRLFDQNELSVVWLENTLNTPEGIDRLESFVSKFSRMQDMFVDKLLPLFLIRSGETPKTAIDNLHRLEQLNIISDANDWLDMRLLRNKLVHEYVDDMAQLFEHLLLAKTFFVVLSQSFERLRNILENQTNSKLA